ncbi:MAG TPA: hypothetical protein VI750_05920 [Pyrinomonadaceae bacterium]|nr:hypothetical protein [Pyrinomonadaceae bacterium]HLE62651.1 hypothetical protein [Pyrinomonadaceae bacterium]
MGIARILRRMGLPGWTLLGVAVSATVISYGGKLLEHILESPFQGFSSGARGILISLALIALALSPVMLAWLWQRSRFIGSASIREGEPPERKRGLILLVSRPESAMHAVEFHFQDGSGPLETVWLIPSNGQEADRYGGATWEVAEAIREHIKELSNNRLRVEIHETGVSPGDAQDTFDYVNRIFRRRTYNSSEIIADFTGGTKPMTVGMVMACLPRDRELQYVPYNKTTGQMDGPYLFDYEHSVFDLVG